MKKRLIAAFILIVYSTILIKIMVFKDLPLIRIGSMRFNFGGTQEGAANLVPFKTILPYLLGEKGFVIAVINLVGNIILLVPIGFLLPFVNRNITWKQCLAVALAAGLTIEGMQELLHVGIFDIDDVILNGLGVIVGYWMFAILSKMERSMRLKTVIIAGVIVIAVAIAALYAIYPKGQRRINSWGDTDSVKSDRIDSIKSERFDNGESKISQGADPCNGTGGTGQIVSVGNNTITIKRNDGINQTIKLTDQTTIKNSVSALSPSDLKPGNRVTVVIDDSETATVVLVCNVASAEKKVK